VTQELRIWEVLLPEHFRIFLAQVLRSPSIAELACQLIMPEHLKSAGATRGQALIYRIIKDYYDAHKICPDDGIFLAELARFCALSASGRPEVLEDIQEEFAQFKRYRPNVDARSEPHVRGMIKSIAEKCIHGPAMEELLSSALSHKNLEGLGKQIQDIEAKQAAISGGLSFNNIISTPSPAAGERVSSGIPWLDARLGNGRGPVNGCGIAIIAGQGVGKTAMGIQMAIAQALQERHTLLVLAEEGLSQAIKRRIISCAIGVSTVALEAAKDDLDVIAKASENPVAIAKRFAAVDKYVHVLDLVKNSGDLDAITGEISAKKLSNSDLAYVYVDWAGPIADRMLQRGNKALKSKYDALKLLQSEIAQCAARNNIIISISHQMAAKNFKMGARAENDHYCGMDCNSFTEMMKYAFVINPRDSTTGISIFKIAKARDDIPDVKIPIKLKGELSQFVDCSHQFEIAAKSNRLNSKLDKEDKSSHLPKE